MDSQGILFSLGTALGIGFLIGLQREQAAREESGGPKPLGGVRTYPLVALLGALAALMARPYGAWILGAALVALLVPLGLAYADDLRRDRDRGITSEMAFVVTLFLGALCTTPGILPGTHDRLLVAAAAGVGALALLSGKKPLHQWAQKMSSEDVHATVKFAILAVIILPLLPNRTYGPYDVLNPFTIGLMIVLVAGVSFVGYVAIRLLGPGRGLGVTGLFGGMVSSTATTLSLSSRAKEEKSIVGLCALGIILASAVMPVRVLVEVFVVNSRLLPAVAWPIGAMAAAGFATGVVYYLLSRRQKQSKGDALTLENPFELSSALKIGGLFAVILFLSKVAQVHLGSAGTYITGVVAGLTDVDAITLSMAKLAPDGTSYRQAALTIYLACVSNSLVKAGMAATIGGWALGRRVLLGFLVMILGGAAGAAVLLLGPES